MPRLVACSSCSIHVKSSDAVCPHCGTRLRQNGVVGKTATAVLMGLSLTACPADEDPEETAGSSMSSTGEPGASSGEPTTGEPDPSTGQPEPGATSFASDYGVPSTSGGSGSVDGTGSSGGSSGGSGSGSDSGSSDGGGSTSIGEPEYGVPTTGSNGS